MFVFSCASFLLAASYNILTDILYLAMIHQKISIQRCSVLRNFLLNPLAVQAVVDAVDRFIVIFGYGTMETVMIFLFYLSFPLVGVIFSFINSFLSTDLAADEFCGLVRRSSWTQHFMYAVQWMSTVVAVVLYFLIYRKVTKHFEQVRSSHNTGNLTQERYYKDRSIVSLFFFCCTIPIVLATPTIAVQFLELVFDVHNKSVDLVASALLDLSILSIWTAYVIYVPSVRHGVRDLFTGKEQCEDEFDAAPADATSAALTLTKNSMCFEHQGHADNLLLVSGRTSGCGVVGGA
ncbi:hypothetical protein Aduo_003655 [Ancylostoma duodenale]